MKKKISIFFSLILLVSVIAVPVTIKSSSDDVIRVGLIYAYNNKDSITIKNNSIVLDYYDSNGNLTDSKSYSSSNGFTFTPASSKSALSNDEYIEKEIEMEYEDEEILESLKYDAMLKALEENEEIETTDILNEEINASNKLVSSTSTSGNITMNYSGGTVTIDGSNIPLIRTEEKTNGVEVIDLGSYQYRGYIEIVNINGKLRAINQLLLEEYLYGVVPCEMPALWHMEALKAQSIAARNYAMLRIGKGSNGYDVDDTVSYQRYKGFGAEHSRSNQAVDDTNGELIYYNGSLISAYYHSSSGGWTENSENVWTNSVAYLKAVEDKYEATSSYSNWEITYTASEIANNVSKDIGDVVDVVVESYSDAGRVLEVTVVGTKDSATFNKDAIRWGFGSLYSTRFTMDKTEYNSSFHVIDGSRYNKEYELNGMYILDGNGNKTKFDDDEVAVQSKSGVVTLSTLDKDTEYTFVGSGWGHGVGMSQYGAKGMAENGFTYKEILQHYYTGVEIK